MFIVERVGSRATWGIQKDILGNSPPLWTMLDGGSIKYQVMARVIISILLVVYARPIAVSLR